MMKCIFNMIIVGITLVNIGGVLQAAEVDPQKGTLDSENNIVWYDAQLLTIEGKGWSNTVSFYDRLPQKAENTVRKAVWNLSHDSAGICVRFITGASTIQVRWTLRDSNLSMPHMPATGVSGVDLYGKNDNGMWTFLGNGRPEKVSNQVSFKLIPNHENILYLPLYNGVKSLKIGVPKGKTLSTPEHSSRDLKKPIVFYGTSITQGGCASRPGMAATAIVSRKLDVPIINLGFSGNGRMEPEMADLLGELDPSIFVLDCLWNMKPEMVSERVEPFVIKLRQAHPHIPILLAEDSSVKNKTPTQKGRILRTIYKRLTDNGIENIYFLSNEGMLGTDNDGTVDGTHPNDLGMMRQADIFTICLKNILQTSKNPK